MPPVRRGGAAGRVAHGFEAGEAARLGLERVDGQGLEDAAAGVRDVIAAAADRAAVPGVDDVEGERHVRGMRGVEAFGGGQARKRTPATASPLAVGASGSG